MAGLGPKVGSAHVDVNLKFDDNTVKTVGKRIQKQLSTMSSRVNEIMTRIGDRNREIYRGIGRDAVTAWRAALGAAVSAAPLIGSLFSGLAAAATMLAGALASVVRSAFALGPILASLGVAGFTAYLGMKSFFQALQSGDLSELTPSARAAAQAVQGLAGAWQRVKDTVQENLFRGLADDIAMLGSTLLPVLERGLGKMATALNGLAQEMLNYLNSADGMRTINLFLDNMAGIFTRLSGAVVPFLDGFLNLMNALSPSAERLADRITNVARKFQGWTEGAGFAKNIDDMMKKAEKTAGLFFEALINLGVAINNVFNASNPATNSFLQWLVEITQKFRDWSASVSGQNSIAEWAEGGVAVMKQLGDTIAAVVSVVKELATPEVIISFLTTVEGAFRLLAKLPLEAMVNGFVKIAEALQPISSAFLAIIIAGAAFNIMLGNLMGQLGGLFSVLGKVVKFKILTNILKGTGTGANAAGAAAAGAAGKTSLLSKAWQFLVGIFTKVKSVFSSVVGFFTKTGKATGDVATKASKLSGAFKPVMSILGKFAKFAGPVGLVVWIGSIIAGSKDLQKKFGEVWDAVKEVGAALSGAFKEIGEALKPLAPAAGALGSAIGTVFGWVDKLVELALGVFLDMVIYGFKSLANVIKGAGSIIAGVINIIVGLFTLDFGKMWDGLKQVFSGLGNLLKGAAGLLITFFAPAKFLKWAGVAIKGLGNGIKGAAPGVLSTVGSFLAKILKFFITLPLKLLQLGGKAITSLWNAITTNAPRVLSSIGSMVTGVIQWIGRLPGKLLSLGTQAITKLWNAVVTNTPRVLTAATNIFNGVVQWIGRLPGKLLSLGQQAITKLAGAVQVGVGRLRTIATNIFNVVVQWISKLPGRLLSLGQQSITKLAGAVQTGVGRLRTIATNIFNAVVQWISKLPGRLLSLGQQSITKLAGAVQAGVGRLREIAGNIATAIVDKVKSLPGELLGIGKSIIAKLAEGILSGLGKVKDAAGKVAKAIKDFLPGSPVNEGPLTAWNRGGDATGGGRNVVDAITAGLADVSPIKKAMGEVASAVASSMNPTMSHAGRADAGGRNLSIVINNPQAETGSDSLTRTTRNLAYLGLA